jgi:hypothetical protein
MLDLAGIVGAEKRLQVAADVLEIGLDVADQLGFGRNSAHWYSPLTLQNSGKKSHAIPTREDIDLDQQRIFNMMIIIAATENRLTARDAVVSASLTMFVNDLGEAPNSPNER